MKIMNRVNKLQRKYQLHELIADTPSTKITTGTKEIIVPFHVDKLSQAWYDWIILGMPIQNAFGFLSNDEREFIMTGVTSTEWNQIFDGKEY